MDDQRALLDMLMGKTRNLPDSMKGDIKEVSFHDKEVCKYFMCGLCPFILFRATKSDLGPCPKQICDNSDALELRHRYSLLSQADKDSHGYEYDLMLYLEDLVRQCDARIAKNKKRAEKDMQISEESLAKIAVIEGQIRELNEECVAAAEEGDIDKSQEISRRIDVLKSDIDALASPKDQKITTVCEVSGNFMSTRDNDERMRAHFEGKQFLGWKTVRDMYSELKARNLRPPERGSRSKRPLPEPELSESKRSQTNPPLSNTSKEPTKEVTRGSQTRPRNSSRSSSRKRVDEPDRTRRQNSSSRRTDPVESRESRDGGSRGWRGDARHRSRSRDRLVSYPDRDTGRSRGSSRDRAPAYRRDDRDRKWADDRRRSPPRKTGLSNDKNSSSRGANGGERAGKSADELEEGEEPDN